MIIFITLTNLIVGLLQFDCDHPHHRTLIEFELSDNVLGHREQTRTGVCEKNTPPENKRRGTVSLQNTNSGAG